MCRSVPAKGESPGGLTAEAGLVSATAGNKAATEPIRETLGRKGAARRAMDGCKALRQQFAGQFEAAIWPAMRQSSPMRVMPIGQAAVPGRLAAEDHAQDARVSVG